VEQCQKQYSKHTELVCSWVLAVRYNGCTEANGQIGRGGNIFSRRGVHRQYDKIMVTITTTITAASTEQISKTLLIFLKKKQG
jgi:hypothetical protein